MKREEFQWHLKHLKAIYESILIHPAFQVRNVENVVFLRKNVRGHPFDHKNMGSSHKNLHDAKLATIADGSNVPQDLWFNADLSF